MKTLNLYLMLLLGSWNVVLSQSPIIGIWTGTYGSGGTTQTPNFYSLKFNADGTMQVLNQGGGVIAQGRASITNNNVSGSYTYTGQSSPYSVAGVYNPSNNTIAGTWGPGNSPAGGGGWIMTSKSGGSAPATTSVPFGSKGTYTRAAPTGTKQPVTAQPMMKSAPVASGMVISGVVQPSPEYRYPAQDGISVTTRLVPAQGSGSSIMPRIKVNNSGQTLESSDATQDCYLIKRSLSVSSDNFLNTNFGARSANLYPGAIYVFEEFMDGNFRPLEQSRNPIVISSSNLANTTSTVYRNVANPQSYLIKQEISEIIKPYSTQIGSGNIEYRVFESNNRAELMVSATAGGGYAGFEASSGFNQRENSAYYYLTIDALKPMYILETNIPANGYFSDNPIIPGNKQLVVIRSVVYGTRVLANVEMKAGNTQADIEFMAKVNAFGVTGSATFDYLKRTDNATKQINMLVVGGPSPTTIYTNPTTLQDGIENIMKTTTLNMAQPIAYVLSDINGNIWRVESSTDVYTDRDCVPKGAIASLSRVRVKVLTGQDPKDQGSDAEFDLYTYSADKRTSFNTFSSPAINIEFPANSGIIGNPIDLAATSEARGKILSEMTNGSYLDIFFTPKQIGLGWDEWNIKGVTIDLVFKDQFNIELPVTIEHSNLNIWMKKNEQRLRVPFTITDPKNITKGYPFMPK